jgi:hypothetical protein
MQKIFSFRRSCVMAFTLTNSFLLTHDMSFGQPLKVGVAGLSHDHVNGLLHQSKNGEVHHRGNC